MKSLIQAALLTTLLATHAAAAAAPVADDAIFLEGTRYNAVLSRSQGAWRLMPANGGDIKLRVSPDCASGTALPRGLWLLTRDGSGQPELVAPSATPLPAGHPGHVRLVDCDRPATGGTPALAIPPGLVEWLEHRSGAIYVVQ
ncbi:MAG: hypothetical protein NT046_03835 [Arenimonas sp.]|nr:hypothetical protein [Arenimonas sp.]